MVKGLAKQIAARAMTCWSSVLTRAASVAPARLLPNDPAIITIGSPPCGKPVPCTTQKNVTMCRWLAVKTLPYVARSVGIGILLFYDFQPVPHLAQNPPYQHHHDGGNGRRPSPAFEQAEKTSVSYCLLPDRISGAKGRPWSISCIRKSRKPCAAGVSVRPRRVNTKKRRGTTGWPIGLSVKP